MFKTAFVTSYSFVIPFTRVILRIALGKSWSGFLTITVLVDETSVFSIVAVMIAEPSLIAVILPFWSTVAIDSSLDDHVTFAVSGVTVAVNLSWLPSKSSKLFLSNMIASTLGSWSGESNSLFASMSIASIFIPFLKPSATRIIALCLLFSNPVTSAIKVWFWVGPWIENTCFTSPSITNSTFSA